MVAVAMYCWMLHNNTSFFACKRAKEFSPTSAIVPKRILLRWQSRLISQVCTRYFSTEIIQDEWRLFYNDYIFEDSRMLHCEMNKLYVCMYMYTPSNSTANKSSSSSHFLVCSLLTLCKAVCWWLHINVLNIVALAFVV